MYGDMFRGLDKAFAVLGALAMVGAVALVVLIGYGAYWLISHLQWVN